MKPLVFDATPLIYLTKVGLQKIIRGLSTRKFAARSVFREVVERGVSRGLADALALAELFEAKSIGVIDPSDTSLLRRLKKVNGLEESDAETLAAAKEHDYRAIVDDLLARNVARTYNIDFAGTSYALIVSVKHNPLTRGEAIRAVDDMIESGWSCGPELYRRTVASLEQC